MAISAIASPPPAVIAVRIAAVLAIEAGREARNRKGAVVISERAIAAAEPIAAVKVAGAIAAIVARGQRRRSGHVAAVGIAATIRLGRQNCQGNAVLFRPVEREQRRTRECRSRDCSFQSQLHGFPPSLPTALNGASAP